MSQLPDAPFTMHLSAVHGRLELNLVLEGRGGDLVKDLEKAVF